MSYTFHQLDCIQLHEDITGVGVRLVYLDPPYSCKSEDKYYGVGDSFRDYLYYISRRLEKIKSVVSKNGYNILIHVDYKAAHYLKVEADTIFGRENFQNEIAWCYASPSNVNSHLPRKHDTILWYGVGKYRFNQPFTPYVGKLKVGGKAAWDPTAHESEYLAQGKKLEDWWIDIPSLCRNEPEKVGYPTQKPLKLMERIVKTFSNPNDVVLDPFCGSGSFIHAAHLLERQAYGLDISQEAIDIATKRLGGIKYGKNES